MRLRVVVATLVAICITGLSGQASMAKADPLIQDLYGWVDGNLNQSDTDAVTFNSSGGGDFEQRDECDSDMFGSCYYFTGPAAPLIRADASGSYPAGSKATWTYTVPGGPDTYIKEATTVGLNMTGETEETLETGEPHAFIGVWNGSSWSDLDSTDETGEVALVGFEGEDGDRQIKFGLEADSTPTMLEDHWGGLGLIAATLGDDVPPLQTVDPLDVPSGWVDETPIDIPVEAEDGGLGISRIVALGPKRNPANPFDWYGTETSFDCVGTTEDPCPLETPGGTKVTIDPAGMREGHTLISIGTFDAMDNLSENEDLDHDMKIDTKDPTVSLGGSFSTAPGMVLDGPLYALETDANDGNVTVANSGVVGIQVLIDNVVIDSDTQSCSTENCDMGLDTDIDPDNYANGPHTLKVKATDAVGHVKTETVEFEVDR